MVESEGRRITGINYNIQKTIQIKMLPRLFGSMAILHMDKILHMDDITTVVLQRYASMHVKSCNNLAYF